MLEFIAGFLVAKFLSNFSIEIEQDELTYLINKFNRGEIVSQREMNRMEYLAEQERSLKVNI